MTTAKILSYLTLAGALVGTILSLTVDSVQAFWAAHATAGMVASFVVTKVALFLPSPAAAKPEL